jgi:hypothetical protein
MNHAIFARNHKVTTVQVEIWVDKALEETRRGKVVVMLIPAR